MECKLLNPLFLFSIADELIDTLWNVNETTESEDETEWEN